MGKWQRSLYLPNLPMGEDGRKVTGGKEHLYLTKEAAKEGMVLLKNQKSLLPLAKGTKVVLFGKASVDYVKSGGGSGDVGVDHTTNLTDGILQGGDLELYLPLVERYQAYVEKEHELGNEPGLIAELELAEDDYSKAAEFADVAIVSFNRFSGEAWDRRGPNGEGPDAGDPVCGVGCLEKSIQLFERGDFFLSKKEEALIAGVKAHFHKIVVILNVGGMVDTTWIANDDGIDAAMIIWNAGMEGGLATAEVLVGNGYPSGKLSDTFAASIQDYPSTDGFHESYEFVNYTEDIFVGYRYFETFAQAKEKVVYPFGYGLSYTAFSWEVTGVSTSDSEIVLDVSVKNTGASVGKEVIQVYAKAPQGKLGKAARVLVGFAKTEELAAGESTTLQITVPVMNLASFDDMGQIQKSAFVLEAGEYALFVGNSIENASEVSARYVVASDRVLKQCEAKCVPTNLPKRLKADGSYEALPQTEGNDPNASEISWRAAEGQGCLSAGIRALPGRDIFRHPYSEDHIQLIDVVEGRKTMDELVSSMSEEDLIDLLGGQPNNGVSNTYGIGNQRVYGIPNALTADGPAGLRVGGETGITTTAWPCATSIACSFNEKLAERIGAAAAKEVKENNIAIWLAPAVNIHRSPLCGRNFEYYSEDPLLAGKIGAAMVRGIQSQKVAATVKHFACNNKETNRVDSDSRVSERALREIYLKQFEIIVKESDPWCIMTAYNILNGHRTSENRELIQGILRDDWNYQGMVMSDWWNRASHYKEVKAGNDVKMAVGFYENIKEALERGVLTREDMEVCVKRTLEMICKLD